MGDGSEVKVLIVGASGFLGRALCDVPVRGLHRVPAARNPRPPFPGSDCIRVDVTDAASVAGVVSRVRPDWVINAAAEAGVDQCERNPDLARRVNVCGTRNLIRACESAGAGLVTVSTNYVFDGQAGPYAETDCTNPLNVYGRTKLEAEAIVLASPCHGLVVRTAVLYGYRSGCRPNFVTWALESLRRGETIRVVTDEWANPTSVDELAVFLLGLCRREFRGVIHFAGLEFMSRYEMVRRICRCFDLNADLVVPVTSEALGQTAPRPPGAGLKLDLARKLFNPALRSFSENLKRMGAEMRGAAG
ncbi:MAG: dTDP-4-dehydrorhamnose reductase [Gemmatimonadota bacterium]|nr:dTDP-4-dehydrorhamnose reductase [Gemmatimonadota bacterium]